jgi:murein DD-endopeptidase MepM/ murein hydrolase activator NlpD
VQVEFIDIPQAGFEIASPLPIPLVVTSPFNDQRDYGLHEGIDLKAVRNDGSPVDVLAVADGTVIWASDKRRVDGKPSKYGNHVIIDHGNGFITWYCHLASFYVQSGRIVLTGDRLGLAGSTGNSTGIHLHFTIQDLENGLDGYAVGKVIDPAPLLGL